MNNEMLLPLLVIGGFALLVEVYFRIRERRRAPKPYVFQPSENRSYIQFPRYNPNVRHSSEEPEAWLNENNED